MHCCSDRCCKDTGQQPPLTGRCETGVFCDFAETKVGTERWMDALLGEQDSAGGDIITTWNQDFKS